MMSSDFFSAMDRPKLSRRDVLRTAGVAALAALPVSGLLTADELKGRIKQSVCLWCYNGFLSRTKMDLDAFAAACKKLGLLSIELTGPKEWPTLAKHGLICAMVNSHGITKGFNRVQNHEECIAKVREGIDLCVEHKFPNVIAFSGNRDGMADDEGLKNCVTGLKKVAGYAEEKKVTICVEYLNSINHKDYMADTTKWCVELVKQVGSPRVKVLYDIYHAAMMKEDVLADIKNHHECWGHYHTGGMPGRNEIDGTQTLDYPTIMRAIVETGYQGYVGQEFIPKRDDALASLEQAVKLCDV